MQTKEPAIIIDTVLFVSAYEILSDADKRKQYDMYGESAFQPGGGGGGGGGGGPDFNFNYHDFFKGFDEAFKRSHDQRHRNAHNFHHQNAHKFHHQNAHNFGNFHFSFDDFFNDDDDDDDIFGSFGGFGDFFGEDHNMKKYQQDENQSKFFKSSHTSQKRGRLQLFL